MAGLTTIALVAGGLAAAGGVTSAFVSADAAKDAARAQRNSLADARRDSEQGFQRATDLQQPFLERGTQAFNQL